MKNEYPLVRAESKIPKGVYCYTPLGTVECPTYGWRMKISCCPFWERCSEKIHGPLPEQYAEYQEKYDGAYCSYLHTGDWLPDGTMILWDQVKSCGVNDDWDDESGEM